MLHSEHYIYFIIAICFGRGLGGWGGGLEKENFCAVISMNICNDHSIPPFPPTVFFYIPYHILYRCISCLFYDFTNSLSFRSTTPFSQNFSAVRADPTPYNFHTLNEIKDLCNMQTDRRTDRRTEIACTLIIIIRGGYNTILCIGSAHCFVPSFF